MAVITKTTTGNLTSTTTGDDVVIINDPTKLLTTDLINGQGGNDEIRFGSTTSGQTLTLGAGITNFEYVTITTSIAAGVPGAVAGSANLNVNAAAVTGNLTITGNDGNNVLVASKGVDQLYGNGGNDVFVFNSSLTHNDSDNGAFVDGGTGTNEIRFSSATAGQTLIVDDATDANVQLVTIGTGLGDSAVTTGVTTLNVDASGYTGGGNDGLTIVGNAGNNTITGTENDDVIVGSGGNDTLNGGLGADVFIVKNGGVAFSGTTVNGGTLGEGNEIWFASTTAGDTLTLTDAKVSNIDAVFLGSATYGTNYSAAGAATGVGVSSVQLNVDASGYSSALLIEGNDGNNVITGTSADDVMLGGKGNDVFIIKNGDSHGLNEVIDGGDGVDEIRFTSTTSGDTLVLSPYIDVERIVIGTGTLATGTASAATTAITSGSTALNVDATAVAAATLADSGAPLVIIGNAGNNHITGSIYLSNDINAGAGNDILMGSDNGDTLTGGAGSDSIFGGTGDDTYLIANATDFTSGDVISDAGGTDTIRITAPSGVVTLNSHVTGIEAVTLAGAGAIGVNASAVGNGLTITGNSGSNAITGTDLSDVITGGAGADVLKGGNGDDIFRIGSGADGAGADGTKDVINGGNGNDTIVFENATNTALAKTLTLGAGVTNVENVVIGTYDPNTGLIDSSDLINNNVNAAAVTSALNITGNAGNNVIVGGAGNDTIEGSYGQDTLIGGAGNDTFVVRDATEYNANTGNDSIDGGTGNNTLLFIGDGSPSTLTLDANLKNVSNITIGDTNAPGDSPTNLDIDASAVTYGLTIIGNDGDNVITGTSFADNINAGDGDDFINILHGVDHGFNETIDGGAGTNEVRFYSTVNGDTLYLNNNDQNIQLVTLGNGVDYTRLNLNTVLYGGGDLEVYGNAGNNKISTGTGNDLIHAGDGNDMVSGGAGNDTIHGGAGNDILGGGLGDDELHGGDGNDVLVGNAGTDSMYGGAGDDIFVIASGAEHTSGEVIDGGTPNGFNPTHGEFGDAIYFTSHTANDTLTLSSDVTNIQTVIIGQTTPSGPYFTGTTPLNVDAHNVSSALLIIGSAGNNTITGTDDVLHNGPNSIDDYLMGGGGNDVINARDGNDVLEGDAGNDTLTGGNGADVFLFNTALNSTGNVDTITDFTSGDGDLISLSKSIFGSLTGNVGDGVVVQEFGSAASYLTASGTAKILYDETSGNLYYDANGGTHTDATLFAHLTGAPVLAAGDFILS